MKRRASANFVGARWGIKRNGAFRRPNGIFFPSMGFEQIYATLKRYCMFFESDGLGRLKIQVKYMDCVGMVMVKRFDLVKNRCVAAIDSCPNPTNILTNIKGIQG